MTAGESMLTKKEVKALLHYKSDSGFHEFLKRTPTFPKPVKLGLRRVGWAASEVDAYLDEQLNARDGA
ncbi:TPA: AlpA family phage regulatory protein [Proteus mirabilis]|nr:AlpA family phage regulatory protein [Proteus mirabilis]HCD1100861.1 AlpA family phage regulatory protein [Proteus mirabilis]HCD1123029.1 AlpA family phage regulatory protein [Proteus mirabilis]HEK2691324.1 AlpA family phage regulatory protein [Proteus mirabilis]